MKICGMKEKGKEKEKEKCAMRVGIEEDIMGRQRLGLLVSVHIQSVNYQSELFKGSLRGLFCGFLFIDKVETVRKGKLLKHFYHGNSAKYHGDL